MELRAELFKMMTPLPKESSRPGTHHRFPSRSDNDPGTVGEHLRRSRRLAGSLGPGSVTGWEVSFVGLASDLADAASHAAEEQMGWEPPQRTPAVIASRN